MASSYSSSSSAFSSSASANVSSAESSTTKITPLPFSTSSVITPVKLDGENFTAWEKNVFRWFRSHGLTDHLSNKKAMEIAGEERQQWMRIDHHLVRLLRQSMHPTFMVKFRRCRTCSDLWMKVLLQHWEASVTSAGVSWQVPLLRSPREKARAREARLLSRVFHDLKIDTENNNQERHMS